MKSNLKNKARFSIAIAVTVLAFTSLAVAQVKKPITKKGMITAIKINGLTTKEFIREIESRGVDFEMTSSAESELLGAGGRPEVVEAARNNYRPAAAVVRPGPATVVSRPSTPSGPTPSGPPLSKDGILELLRNGVSSDRVERNVEARGVTFSMTPEVAREIKAAGGTNSLVGAITEKAQSPSTANNDNTSIFAPSADAGPTYDDLIESASNSYLSRDFTNAVKYVQQAIKVDAQRPNAYQLIGLWFLESGEVGSAEQSLRAALERNGSAPFKVGHDHDGSFNQYCVGSFFVSKTGVSFVADDGRHTFEVADSNMKETKKNAFVGAAMGAFHVKPVVKVRDNEGRERDNFNLAPMSGNKAVSDLIIRLVQAY